MAEAKWANVAVRLDGSDKDISIQWESATWLVEVLGWGANMGDRPGERTVLLWAKRDHEDLECVDSFSDADFGKVFDKFREFVAKCQSEPAASA